MCIYKDRQILGWRYKGNYNNEPKAGDIYVFAFGNRLLILSDFDLLNDSTGVLNGRALKLIKPIYPGNTPKIFSAVEVRVKLLIDEAGKVVSAKAVSGEIYFAAMPSRQRKPQRLHRHYYAISP